MKLYRLVTVLALCCLLTGCASLLEREYTVVEPHSSKLWESEAADTLRAESYQDIVNDLLLLINRHTESATIRLYNFENEAQVTDALERAAQEVQQETPMGAYAVEYIASASQTQRGYYEASVEIGYRRTLEQVQAVVNATSTDAVRSLVRSALEREQLALAIRISYWGSNGRAEVEESVLQLREELGLTEAPEWVVNYYPATGTVGLVEFLMDPEQDPEKVRWPKADTVEPAPQPGEGEAPEGTEPVTEETELTGAQEPQEASTETAAEPTRESVSAPEEVGLEE